MSEIFYNAVKLASEAANADETPTKAYADLIRADGATALATLKTQVDTLSAEVPHFTAQGNLEFNAGMDMRVLVPQPDSSFVARPLLDTDNNGNFKVGSPDSELAFYASETPTVNIDSVEYTLALVETLPAYAPY